MEDKKTYDKTNVKSDDEVERAVELERSEEPKQKNETGIRIFIIIMTGIMILAAALTEGTYNGYDPDPNDVAITGFFAIVTILMTAVWYRSKYNNFSYKPDEFRRHYKKMKKDREKK
jgi:hypothetical protein